MTSLFAGIGVFEFVSPLKLIIHPVASQLERIIGNHIIILIAALVCLFLSMAKIIENMKGIVMEKVEVVINRYLFRNALISLLFGMVFTALVQSSSIATSIIIPLVGAGLLTVDQVFPYTLGANIGTTITAILAALSLGIEAGIAVAFSHLLYNLFGIAIIYPLKRAPLWTAKTIARYVAQSKKHFVIFLIIYIALHFFPILFTFYNSR